MAVDVAVVTVATEETTHLEEGVATATAMAVVTEVVMVVVGGVPGGLAAIGSEVCSACLFPVSAD